MFLFDEKIKNLLKNMNFTKIIYFIGIFSILNGLLLKIFWNYTIFSEISINFLNLLILLFFIYFIDIFGLDGGCLYVFVKILGGIGDFEKHTYIISTWKVPLFFLMILTFSFNFIEILLLLVLLEIFLLTLSFCYVHKISLQKSLLISSISLLIFFYMCKIVLEILRWM